MSDKADQPESIANFAGQAIATLLTRIEQSPGGSEGEGGRAAAAEELFPLVYQELRKRAAYYLAQHRPGNTLQATAIVHEAYLKLAGGDSPRQYESQRHFFNAAAEAMRQILVDHARASKAQKRGGGATRLDIDRIDPQDPSCKPETSDQLDLEALDRALGQLRQEDPRRYQVVMYRYFAGLEHKRIAELLEISQRTVERDWKLARQYLRGKLAS
ncbi:ECF-type sigma factor [Fontivita pretiosa]|uniref:ECF-type sigma factor n=1 Tax=Fontivita pretiosa TaxID=2989684 RepID=UPI003D1852B7